MTGWTGITATIRRGTAPLIRTVALVLGVTGGLVGCGALDVSDPTAIEDQELNDAQGAALLRGAALRALSMAVDDGAYFSGLLADEFLSAPPSTAAPGTWEEDLLDRRQSVEYEALAFDPGGYGLWQEVRRAATVALPKLHAYAPAARVGEMFALRGFAALRLAEDFCPGFPLHDVVDLKAAFSPPLSTEEAFAKALADFDSAVAYAADSARILHLAQVGRARTLLGLGRIEEAGAAVTGVPTDFIVWAEYLATDFFLQNRLFFSNLWRGVADHEGGTGLDFVSAEDPRIPTDSLGVADDGVTAIYTMGNYPTQGTPIVLASGIEARLIEAEAALQGGGDWLGVLNVLRTEAVGGVAGLAPLSDPGTDMARQDLLFRERAFWLFATGHRLADLRRLVRVYNRPIESVFPTGAHRLAGTYASATSIPFPAVKETPYNPAVTGCTTR